MLCLLQVNGEALDSPPTSAASLKVKDGAHPCAQKEGLFWVWSKCGFNITFSHTPSVCHLCHVQHGAQNLSSVQCLTPICPVCPTQMQPMAAAQPLTPDFPPLGTLTFHHQCHQIPASNITPLNLPVGWRAALPPAGPRTSRLSANLPHPSTLTHSSPFHQVLLLLWHLEVTSYILIQSWRNQ